MGVSLLFLASSFGTALRIDHFEALTFGTIGLMALDIVISNLWSTESARKQFPLAVAALAVISHSAVLGLWLAALPMPS